MGILSGAVSFCRYQVKGELPEDFWDFAGLRLKKFALRDIDDTSEEKSAGWVSLDNIFDKEFRYANHAKGNYLTFSLRIDVRRIPSQVFKKHYQREEEAYKNGKVHKKLFQKEKQELRERVKIILLPQMIPVPYAYDVIWNIADGIVYLGSLQEKIREQFMELFKKTFELDLSPVFPFTLSEKLVGGQKLTHLVELEADSLMPDQQTETNISG